MNFNYMFIIVCKDIFLLQRYLPSMIFSTNTVAIKKYLVRWHVRYKLSKILRLFINLMRVELLMTERYYGPIR